METRFHCQLASNDDQTRKKEERRKKKKKEKKKEEEETKKTHRRIKRTRSKRIENRAHAHALEHFDRTSLHSPEWQIKKSLSKTHGDEVRPLHDPSGRRSASLFFVRSLTSIEAIPFLRAANSARSASYRQRSSTCHRVKAAPSKEGRIEKPVQPFFKNRSRRSVSLYIYIGHTYFSPFLAVRFTHRYERPSGFAIPRDGQCVLTFS